RMKGGDPLHRIVTEESLLHPRLRPDPRRRPLDPSGITDIRRELRGDGQVPEGDIIPCLRIDRVLGNRLATPLDDPWQEGVRTRPGQYAMEDQNVGGRTIHRVEAESPFRNEGSVGDGEYGSIDLREPQTLDLFSSDRHPGDL